MERVIYFYPGPEAIFAITSLIISLGNVFKLRPTTRLSAIMKQADADDQFSYVFNLHPKDSNEVIRLATWLEASQPKIPLWLDKEGPNWGNGALHLINSYADLPVTVETHGLKEALRRPPLVRLYRESTVMEALSAIGYNFPEFWKRAAEEMTRGETGEMSATALSYYHAFQACRVKDNWERDKSKHKLPRFFEYAPARLIDMMNRTNDDFTSSIRSEGEKFLSQYAREIYHKVSRETREAINRISTNFPHDALPWDSRKKIGYANLGTVSSCLDMAEVINAGQKKFPKLFIVQYNYDGHDYTGVFSKELNTKQLLEIKDDILEINPREAISILRKKVWNWPI